ncbi:DinB family protein [Pontimicrobium aquaticum]|uniref:DinB family protein n=1 Tax=Pontimicrobium aquaticum TaxID=2565367 RepID=A0A4U0EVK7_9FLAO|nr:DinB family protein [Pontimicrobium aquaticum]TJY35967.1 DinB family protein [Pontimicrobium aquaticum]
MNSKEIILLNFSEIRRRSIKLWRGIPSEYLNWKPDEDAFSIIEMIRHVLEGEHLFHKIIENRGNLGDYQSPWNELPYLDVESELKFSETYRADFLEMISQLKDTDLETIRIERKEVNQSKTLGDYLNRIAYHESVHTGQLLDYLRTIGVERPQIWD